MEITALDPATAPEADLVGWHEVRRTVDGTDTPDVPPPVLSDTVAKLRNPFRTARRVHWLARVDREIAGTCELKLDEAPNHEVGEVTVLVAPAMRRRGVGQALLARAVDLVAAEVRPTITAEVLAGAPGEQFLQSYGFTCALTDQSGILRPALADAADLDAIVEALSAGYRLLRWPGRVPDAWIESFVRAKAAIADAPTGELKWRPPEFDPAKWRDVEEVFARRDHEIRLVVAIHEASRTVAGLTEVAFAKVNPQRATQEDTSVVPQHRGHGLGLAMKADMLRWLRAQCPQVQEIETWNADSNTHMLAINDRLGSRRDRIWCEYQAEVATVVGRLVS